MSFLKSWIYLQLAIVTLSASARAVEPSPVASTVPGELGESGSSSTSPVRKPKGRVSREKDAEGTQAPNRFDRDIIFKSKYELNGKSLEVDTD